MTGVDVTDKQNPAVPLSLVQRGRAPFGGFNLTALRLEITRVLRNRRTLLLIVVVPNVFYFLFGLSNRAVREGGADRGRLRDDQHGRVRRDGGHDIRRCVGCARTHALAGAGSFASRRCIRWPTSRSRCSRP